MAFLKKMSKQTTKDIVTLLLGIYHFEKICSSLWSLQHAPWDYDVKLSRVPDGYMDKENTVYKVRTLASVLFLSSKLP